ncbi:MAG: hypothetical protein CL609_03625 [Anaerolineaceae bacterium]|nr:hypothetical protein [Anaerolineaceae bacterium]
MNKKNLLTYVFVGILLMVCGTYVLVQFAIDVFLFGLAAKALELHPERVPARDVISEDFPLLWSNKTKDGSQHLVYTQIFAPDGKSIIYITPNSMNSIDFSTGASLWTTNIPEDSTFHFYDGKIFSLDSYDDKVPFASNESIRIPSKCNSYDQSTLRVYNPYSGNKEWEYSYQMVHPDQIFFKDNSAFIQGLTIGLPRKFISVFEIDINSGQILGVECQNLNHYSRISNNEGILSSGFYPINRDWEWKKESDKPAFIVEGSKLIMVDRQTKDPISQIEFTGFPLHADDTQLLIKDNILIVYLDDSNQFFAFQMK